MSWIIFLTWGPHLLSKEAILNAKRANACMKLKIISRHSSWLSALMAYHDSCEVFELEIIFLAT